MTDVQDTNAIKVLDPNKPQKVHYCVPIWLRDEQIRLAIQACQQRLEPHYEKRDEPCAVVCFGPSLNATWEQVKSFKYIITCSGAHKFMVSRGIIPTWHVEVDPFPHKVALIGEPHKDVEYLIASTCHQAVFEHLSGYNVKLWHVFDNEGEALRILPTGEWALMGGPSVGLRAMTIARFLGFTDLHIFGMDGCEGPSGKHAAEHPNQPAGHSLTVYDGVEYFTTESMLECARQTFQDLNRMPDTRATFYGKGLVQAMAKHYVPEYKDQQSSYLGVSKPELISTYYREQNAQLHRQNLAYGIGGDKHAKTVIRLADALRSRSILDYGCGKGYLAKAIPWPIWEYDPAIIGKTETPRAADIVVCTDVLEHVEPERLAYVLHDLRRCVLKIGYFVINTGPAMKSLPDGRNTHLIQQDRKWWRKRLQRYFTIVTIIKAGSELRCIVASSDMKSSSRMLQHVAKIMKSSNAKTSTVEEAVL